MDTEILRQEEEKYSFCKFQTKVQHSGEFLENIAEQWLVAALSGSIFFLLWYAYKAKPVPMMHDGRWLAQSIMGNSTVSIH